MRLCQDHGRSLQFEVLGQPICNPSPYRCLLIFYNHETSPRDQIPYLLVLVCLPNRNAEGSTYHTLTVTKQKRLLSCLPNPTAMKVQYLKAKNFVNGLNGMLLRGPSG